MIVSDDSSINETSSENLLNAVKDFDDILNMYTQNVRQKKAFLQIKQ